MEPNNRHLTLTRTDWIIMAGLAALAVTLRLIPGLRTIDDAYITYRYALNLATGQGMVYNVGEAVLGTTTPLYTGLLALLTLITGNAHQPAAYPAISAIMNALADGVTVMLLYRIARRLFDARLPGALLGLLWAVAPKSVTFAIGGMETSVYISFIAAAFDAWLADRTRLSAALAGLATLIRPDALIWAGPLAIGIIVARWSEHPNQPPLKRLPWEELAIYSVILLPWLIFGTLTYGSPLPHSVAAKSVAYRLPPTQALIAFLQHFSTPFFEFDTFGSIGAIVGAVLYPVLAVLGALFLFHTDKRSLSLTVFPWLHALVYIVANPLIFRWYATPPTPFYFLSIIAGVWGLAERLRGSQVARWALSVVGAVWLTTSLNAWTLHPDHGPDRLAPKMAWFQLELLYQQAATSIAPEVGPQTVVAAGDIGAVGWYSGARVLDTLGLISPVSTTYYPIPESMLATSPYAVAPDLIVDQQPDFIIVLETYVRNSLLKDPRFAEMYRLRERIETDIYGSDGMLIFEKRGNN